MQAEVIFYKKKQSSGNVKLIVNIFCCLSLATLLMLFGGGFSHYDQNHLFTSHYYSIVELDTPTKLIIANGLTLLFNAHCLFFMFFFWSWNSQHLKQKLARWSIHLLFWGFVSIFSFGLIPFSSYFTKFFVLLLRPLGPLGIYIGFSISIFEKIYLLIILGWIVMIVVKYIMILYSLNRDSLLNEFKKIKL